MEIEKEELKNLTNINLIDIREHYLYERGHMKNAKNIPLRTLKNMPDKYLSKEKIYYLICESGFNSKRLSKILNSKGYTTYSIKGGYSN